MPRKEGSKSIPRPRLKAGHPYKIIDWERVEQLIVQGLNATQIAATIGICTDTLYSRCISDRNSHWSAYFQEKRAMGDGYLHQAQYQKALKEKNTTMLIWLGKQRLGQKDGVEELQVTPEALAHYAAVLDQLKAAQASSLKKPSNTTSNE